MKKPIIWMFLHGLHIVALVSDADGTKFCSWYTDSPQCEKSEFLCENGEECVRKSEYCNGIDNCGDNSDERYCSVDSCPEDYLKCGSTRSYYENAKCIPDKWKCDGYNDCQNRVDENNCRNDDAANTIIRSQTATLAEQSTIALDKVKEWINNQRNELNVDEKWGSNVDKLSLISYLSETSKIQTIVGLSSSLVNKAEKIYELDIQMLSRLSSMKLKDIPSIELASYLNAFLVMCINPRNFHGYDIVQELRNRVDKANYTNPYVFLALCNAGETITESDKNKLIDIFDSKHRTFWTGMQAVIVMALACANKQPGNEVDSETLREMTLELKQQQKRNGTVVDLPTTALVMQALISINSESDPDNFDELKAFQELLRNQKLDGSFGDMMNTFLVTPVLTCKSLADINSTHCQYGKRDEVSALEYLSRRRGPKTRVQYSLWIGNDRDLERNLILRVPQNMTLYNVMEAAAEVDSRFKLEYSVKNRKPYVTAISGMRDNPLTGKFWFLYVIEDGKPTLSNDSPADIIPKDNHHYVMWYRRGTWID